MKRRDLEKKLAELGWRFERYGPRTMKLMSI
jgi:hypothetical protein